MLRLDVVGDIWYWRGPSPFYFVPVPDEESERLRAVAKGVSYGWGMIPILARIDATSWSTSLFPKDDRYLIPVKDAVRRAEELDEGDRVRVRVSVEARW